MEFALTMIISVMSLIIIKVINEKNTEEKYRNGWEKRYSYNAKSPKITYWVKAKPKTKKPSQGPPKR